MRAHLVLGFDPAPADPEALARLTDGLRAVVRGLVESRSALEALGRAGSVWDGALGAPVVALVRRYSLRMSGVEDAVVGCLTVLDAWRADVDRRHAEVANLTELAADLGTEDGAEARRSQLVARARDIAAAHDRGARDVAAAFEELSTIGEQQVSAESDLAEEVEAALRALAEAVQEWVEAEGPGLVRTAAALGEVAALTTVISELVGVAALGRTPADGAGVRDIISRSPAAHRLIRALHQTWLEVAPASLPEATFAPSRRGELADAIAGRLSGGPDTPTAPAGSAEEAPSMEQPHAP